MKVLVLGAGGPAGFNVCRALKLAGHEVLAADANPDHLVWVEHFSSSMALDEIDVVMAQPDDEVRRLGYEINSELMNAEFFLPKPQTIALCQDKFECGLQWRRAGLREDAIQLIETPSDLGPGWLRARHGAGARAAINARSRKEALHWFAFWLAREPALDFVLEEFLPGRDYSWCGIYYEGELLVSFARERLEYLYPNLTPEGLTGTPIRAQVIDSHAVDEMAALAVSAVDAQPHGVFCVDLREDVDGQPRPTEINAGRFSTTVGLWSLYQQQTNFVALAAELAMGDQARLDGWEDLPAGLVLSRHIDCGYVFQMAKVPA